MEKETGRSKQTAVILSEIFTGRSNVDRCNVGRHGASPAESGGKAVMLSLASSVKILLYTPATDMRKAVNGLSGIVHSEFQADPTEGSLFVFNNKTPNCKPKTSSSKAKPLPTFDLDDPKQQQIHEVFALTLCQHDFHARRIFRPRFSANWSIFENLPIPASRTKIYALNFLTSCAVVGVRYAAWWRTRSRPTACARGNLSAGASISSNRATDTGRSSCRAAGTWAAGVPTATLFGGSKTASFS